MKLKDLETTIELFNKNRIDNKKFFREYIGDRFEQQHKFKPIINQLRMQNYEKANQLLSQLIDINPRDIDALRFRGEFYFTYSKYLAAWEQYDQILKLEPRDREALTISTICACALGDYIEYDDRLKVISFHYPHIASKIEYYIHLIMEHKELNDFDDKLEDDVEIDLIVLFGKKLYKDGQFPPDLSHRLEQTLTLSRKFPKSDILSLGGAVHNRHYEAVATYNWLVDKGISEKRLILDMTGLDVPTQSMAVIDLITQNHYQNVLILSRPEYLPRHYLSLTASLNGNNLDQIQLHAINQEVIEHVDIPEREQLKIWQTTFRSAGVFTKAFYQ